MSIVMVVRCGHAVCDEKDGRGSLQYLGVSISQPVRESLGESCVTVFARGERATGEARSPWDQIRCSSPPYITHDLTTSSEIETALDSLVAVSS